MIGFIGNKIGMTTVFDENGSVEGATIIKVEDNKVLEVKTKDKYNYSALKIGYGVDKKEKRKVVLGQYKKKPVPKKIKEFRLKEDDSEYKVDDVLNLKFFENLKYVNVRGQSFGKGFQGVVKRWNMHGGPATHGSRFHRVPGSIGNCSDPARVFKGKKMPGRMGDQQVMVKNLKILKVDVNNKLLLIKGSVPGYKNNLVYITKGTKEK